jgi:hypothetical protein
MTLSIKPNATLSIMHKIFMPIDVMLIVVYAEGCNQIHYAMYWHHTRYNYTQYKDIQYYDTQHKDTQYYDTQHKYTQYNDTAKIYSA